MKKEKGAKYLGGISRCFAEIHNVDINLHFLEFFGYLDQLLNFICDG